MAIPKKQIAVVSLILLIIISAGCAKKPVAAAPPPVTLPPTARAPSLTLPAPRPDGSCTSQDGFPDPNCTPGVFDPRVTADNIQQTICVSGYTKTVRPPTSYTNPLKVQQIREYGYTDTNVKHYEEDHFIPLELGGHPTDPRNLWPENPPSTNPKDKVETKLHKLVCSGQMSLDEARERIRANWKTALP